MKNTTSQKLQTLRVVPQGIWETVNGQAAPAGTARQAVNLREAEQALQVVGMPATEGGIGAGHTLVLVDKGRHFYLDDDKLMMDGQLLLTIKGDWVGMRAVGQWKVVVTTAGTRVLTDTDAGLAEMSSAGALPQITLTAQAAGTVSHTVPACQFANGYAQWQAPLAEADRQTLTALLREAWTDLNAEAADRNTLAAPVLARWAVRLWDDSYLWMSEPVALGSDTADNAHRITATVATDGNTFTGTAAATWTIHTYTPVISVDTGIDARWWPWIKAIDVFATRQPSLVTAGRTLEYRCITRTTGSRVYELEMGLRRRTDSAIAADLQASAWTLIATATDVAHLTSDSFAPPSQAVSLSNAQCLDVARLAGMGKPVCFTTAGGRLYTCDENGTVSQSRPGNPWVAARRSNLIGVRPLALAAVVRPLYSGGFGRYPVYVFTTDGIFAMPQSALGTMGDARLVDRTVIAGGTVPVEGGGDIFFTSRHGHLCRLRASAVTIVLPDAAVRHMAWNEGCRELWTATASGLVRVIMASGRFWTSTLVARQLYSDPRCAVMVDKGGAVFNLEQEQPAEMTVRYVSRPVVVAAPQPRRAHGIMWDVSGYGLSLTLSVRALRGAWNSDYLISTHRVDGTPVLPISLPLTSQPLHTAALEVDGTAAAGTLFLPVKLVVALP